MNPESLLTMPFAAWQSLLFVAAFAVMAIIGRPMIAKLKALKGMKWSAREDTPDTHAAKAGTPSMGGVGIMLAATLAYAGVVCALLLARSRGALDASALLGHSNVLDPTVPIPPGAGGLLVALGLLPLFTLLHMGLGLADDWSKATGRGGLRARAKLLGQLALSGGFLVALGLLGFERSFGTPGAHSLLFPFDAPDVLLGSLLLFALLVIVLVGVCNAVNITDGIDGLAAGLCVQVGFAFWLASMGAGGDDAALWSDAWWLALGGACAGFLIYNRYKAQVFMGDTGSLALGAAVGAAAILTRGVFLIPFIGFLFFVELLSVTVQVAYFKYTKRKTGEGQRIFRRAPLHHHFELGGWSEKKVVAVFWAINLATSALGLLLWRAGILPRFP